MERRARRALLVATLLSAAALAGLGAFLWRTLPPVIPDAARRTTAPARFAGVPVLPSALPAPRLDGIRVALLTEPENVRLSAPGEYAAIQALWRRWLMEAGAVVVAPDAADVLVAAELRCMGPVHRRLLAAHLERGGGVVATGPVGAFDGVCAPLADTLVAALIGRADSDVQPAPQPTGGGAQYVVVLGETVLGAGLPPGPRMELNPAKAIVFRDPSRDMLYSDYQREPRAAGGARFFDAAAVRALVGTGRVAAFGFSIDDFADDWSRAVGRVVVANATRWAAGHTSFQLAPWPNGRTAAAVLAHDVEADFHNARIALEALDEFGLPGTAFLVGSLAEADPVTTRRLVDAMEIGSHTQRHLPLDTLADEVEARELATSKRVAERLAGRPVLGLRPPEERFDASTLQAWADLGGSYVFLNNDMRAAGPEIIPLLPDSLVLLGRVSEDDYDLLNRDRLRDRGAMTRRILEQLAEMVAYRGLFMFSYHSHMFSQRDLVPVLTALADRLADQPEVWTATAGDVARWWRDRSRVAMAHARDGTHATFRNGGGSAFAGGQVLVIAPAGQVRRVELPPLQPGESVVVDARGDVRQVPPARVASTAP